MTPGFEVENFFAAIGDIFFGTPMGRSSPRLARTNDQHTLTVSLSISAANSGAKIVTMMRIRKTNG